jgi:hypothetical protein
MAIDHARTFGVPAAAGSASTPLFGGLGNPNQGQGMTDRRDLPKAQTWLNFGYPVGEPGTEDYRFVSLPTGIPLDTQEELPIRSNNGFGQFTAARNDFLKQMQEAASGLAPGAEMLIGPVGDTPLYIQLRRVNDPVTPPATDESNPYAAKIFG